VSAIAVFGGGGRCRGDKCHIVGGVDSDLIGLLLPLTTHSHWSASAKRDGVFKKITQSYITDNTNQ